uniref:PPUP7740 n=1 Tax=Poeciliopsis prolifica TaxID=188132 RepID=A0A0S7EW23_9TELE
MGPEAARLSTLLHRLLSVPDIYLLYLIIWELMDASGYMVPQTHTHTPMHTHLNSLQSKLLSWVYALFKLTRDNQAPQNATPPLTWPRRLKLVIEEEIKKHCL